MSILQLYTVLKYVFKSVLLVFIIEVSTLSSVSFSLPFIYYFLHFTLILSVIIMNINLILDVKRDELYLTSYCTLFSLQLHINKTVYTCV